MFISIPPDPDLVPNALVLAPADGGTPAKSLRDLMMGVNSLIEKEGDLGPDYMIGHSFFLSEYGLPAAEKHGSEWVRRFWEWALKPLLEDYCFRSEHFAKLFKSKGFKVLAGRIFQPGGASIESALFSLCD